MTAQTLYNQLVQGTISENKFLYEVRRDPSLTMITKFNSLKDTIQILKSKSIITENKDLVPKYKADKTIPLPEVESFTIDVVSPYEYGKGINYELELTQIAVGQNMPTEEEMVSTQKKVLKNLTSDPYYYTKKCYSDAEKKTEKENLRPEELKKDLNAPNQLIKSKVIKENLDGDCDSCEREELDLDVLTPQQRQLVGQIVEEWGLTELDLADDDILDEIAEELEKREGNEQEMEEAVVVKDKAGNIQYAKDDNEAAVMMNNARTKGVQLTKTRV